MDGQSSFVTSWVRNFHLCTLRPSATAALMRRYGMKAKLLAGSSHGRLSQRGQVRSMQGSLTILDHADGELRADSIEPRRTPSLPRSRPVRLLELK